jgi:hypothetical protein
VTPRPETTENVRPGLTPRMEQAILMFLRGASVGGVAKELNVAERTVTRWRATPEFDAAFTQAKDKAFRSALDDLRIVGGFAVKVLGSLLTHSDPRVRLGAARAVVVGMLHVQEAVSFEERLVRVEMLLAGRDRT